MTSDAPETVTSPSLSPADQLLGLWQCGRRPDLAAFLGQVGGCGPRQLLEILRVDQEQRWRSGEPVAAETYLHDYPALAAVADLAVELIHAEFRLRRGRGEAVSLAEYAARFPAHADRLRQRDGLG